MDARRLRDRGPDSGGNVVRRTAGSVGLCLLFIFSSGQAVADPYDDAVKQAARAYYKHTDLDDRIKDLEHRYTSPAVRKSGGIIVFIAKLVIDKRIDFKVKF
jgi:hypothetical protein